MIKLLPRLDAFTLEGPDWRVVYVGDTLGMVELEYLLFPNGASIRPVQRVAATSLRRFVGRALADADLVVCALPRLWPRFWRARAPMTVTVPIFVNTTVDVRPPLADLLRGNRRQALRYQLKKAHAAGLTTRFTRTREEFERFHTEMYRPHVQRRFGRRALISRMHEQWRGWIVPGGGLLLIEREGRPLAGQLVRPVASTVFLGEEGVSQTAEAEETQVFLRVALRAAVIEYARSVGATDFIMGISLAQRSDPVLDSKLRWRGVVIPGGHCLDPEWTWLSASLPEPLRMHLNQRGLITFVSGHPCMVSIGAPTETTRHAAEPIGRTLVVEPGSDSAVIEVGQQSTTA